MGQMEQTIKSEITRLARKQVRAVCLPLAKDVRRLKRVVSRLRKTVAGLARLGAEFQAQRLAEQARLDAPAEEVRASRISPRLIRKLRTRLGISQGELAGLVGVSAGAVGFWEQGKARPKGRNKGALVALRKLGKREVAGILAAKAEGVRREARGRARTRRKKRR